MHVFYNSKLTEKATIDSMNQGFQFGMGVFETILVYKGLPCFLELHFERLIKSCSKLGLKPMLNLAEITKQTVDLAKLMSISVGRLKIICFKDIGCDSIIVSLAPYQPDKALLEKGLSLRISGIKRNPYSPLSYIKSLNYTENMLAKEEAKAEGYDEALFLNVHGKLSEGAVSNVFWVSGNKVFTPSIENGILDGITRRQVLDICQLQKLHLEEGCFEVEALMQADEVFITNSLMGIMPVCKVDNTSYNVSDYRITDMVRDKYTELVQGIPSAFYADHSEESK